MICGWKGGSACFFSSWGHAGGHVRVPSSASQPATVRHTVSTGPERSENREPADPTLWGLEREAAQTPRVGISRPVGNGVSPAAPRGPQWPLSFWGTATTGAREAGRGGGEPLCWHLATGAAGPAQNLLPLGATRGWGPSSSHKCWSTSWTWEVPPGGPRWPVTQSGLSPHPIPAGARHWYLFSSQTSHFKDPVSATLQPRVYFQTNRVPFSFNTRNHN